MKAIETDKLTKLYGKNRGVDGLSISVDEGDFFGFIGPNGAGKSTTIRTLLGLISPSGGSAAVYGYDICTDREKILSLVGYLPSEALFYRGMRVGDILKFSANLRHMDCTSEADRLCERLQLDTSKRIEELSFGNRKKVGIVCAMQHNPKLYIMDEPTSGLDPLMQKEFFSLLHEKNKSGATVFLSSHVLPEIQKHCKHAAIIREGKLIACDTVDNLGHTEAKRVSLRGIHELPDNPHLRDLAFTEDGLNFLYGGNIQALLRMLSSLPITDITITDPDLEEIFMHFYEKEEISNDNSEA